MFFLWCSAFRLAFIFPGVGCSQASLDVRVEWKSRWRSRSPPPLLLGRNVGDGVSLSVWYRSRASLRSVSSILSCDACCLPLPTSGTTRACCANSLTLDKHTAEVLGRDSTIFTLSCVSSPISRAVLMAGASVDKPPSASPPCRGPERSPFVPVDAVPNPQPFAGARSWGFIRPDSFHRSPSLGSPERPASLGTFEGTATLSVRRALLSFSSRAVARALASVLRPCGGGRKSQGALPLASWSIITPRREPSREKMRAEPSRDPVIRLGGQGITFGSTREKKGNSSRGSGGRTKIQFRRSVLW